MRTAKKHSIGVSVRRPSGKRGPKADAEAEVISWHRSARAALRSLRAQPRTEQGYSEDFLFDEKLQRRISNYEADK